MEENKTVITAPEDKHLDEAYVIAKIDQIMEDSKTLWKALEVLEKGICDANIGHTAFAIGNMIEAREDTNQALIMLLTTIVERLSGLPGKAPAERDMDVPPPPPPPEWDADEL